MITATGANGKITVDENFCTITREGLTTLHKFAVRGAHGYAGEKRIPLNSIKSVQFKFVGDAGEKIQRAYSRTPGLKSLNKLMGDVAGATGYLQLGVSGGKEVGSAKGWRGTAEAIGRDENTVMFNKDQEPDFILVREFIESKITGHSESISLQPDVAPTELAQQIKALKELHLDGVLSDEEFAQAKAKLIG